MAELDRLLSERRHVDLFDRLMAVDPAPDAYLAILNWNRDRIFAGAPLIVSLAHMRLLWAAGSQPGGDGMRETATLIYLYAHALIHVDGARCADPSAATAARDTLVRDPGGALLRLHLAGMGSDGQNRVFRTALGMEQRTAALRKPDEYLCAGGLAGIQAGLAASPQGQMSLGELARSGHGSTIRVAPPADFKPEFVSDIEWPRRAQAARDALPLALARIVRPGG